MSGKLYMMEKLGKEQQEQQRNVVFRDFFDRHDRVPSSAFDHRQKYDFYMKKPIDKTNLDNEVVKLNAQKASLKGVGKIQEYVDNCDLNSAWDLCWALHIEAFLSHLDRDVKLLLKVQKWDFAILQVAYEVVQFFHNMFF